MQIKTNTSSVFFLVFFLFLAALIVGPFSANAQPNGNNVPGNAGTETPPPSTMPRGNEGECTSGAGGTCVNLGNTGGTAPGSGAGDGTTPTEPGDYLSRLYNFLLGLVGVAAMGSIVYGGVLYIISAGNPSQVGSAKQAIWNGIIGILIAGFGYLILYTINPDLVGGFDLKAIIDRNLNE